MQSSEFTVNLDGDSTKIFDSIHDAHKNTALCLGLKLLSESHIFKSFFKDSSKSIITTPESEVASADMTNVLSTNSSSLSVSTTTPVVDAPAPTPSSTPESSKQEGTSTSWESF